mgnify:CR=1 FL=1
MGVFTRHFGLICLSTPFNRFRRGNIDIFNHLHHFPKKKDSLSVLSQNLRKPYNND